ncbi:uncharacterized protein LOC128678561 [Plodia interpunctella]|uniref:uncharacterized protein LOC128678561 n=1 Tax=Plodia interpunctella TaxID=58824 RepID=UPI002368E897|nr:uncharacterized protein LOC128678561 [Plodia interpunctella]
MKHLTVSHVFLLHLFVKMYPIVQSYNYNQIILCTTTFKLDSIEKSFVDVAKGLGYKYEIKRSACDLEEILMFSKNFSSIVISFNVFNFGNVNDSVMNELENLKDIMLERYSNLNDSIDMCDEENHQIDAYGRGCKDAEFNLKTKAFIGSVEKHIDLYNVFRTITDNNDNNYRKKIVVCTDYCHSVDRDYEQFSVFCQSCDIDLDCYENTIAYVVPSPEKAGTPCFEDVPVIFYDTLYIEPKSEEYTEFDYEISTSTLHWKVISKITIDYVIRQRRWKRAAIISDDSPLSTRLTNDQTLHFTKWDILYTVRYCSEIGEFDEALSLFNEFNVAVIIVNVAKENLAKLRRSAHTLRMAYKDVVWIFPRHHRNYIKHFKYRSFVNLTQSYMDALKLVKNEYEKSLGNERTFRKALKNYIPPVTCPPRKQYMVEIPSNFANLRTPDQNCTIRAQNFYFPCSDMPILYIILTPSIFLLIVFIVLAFFNSIKMNTLEYRPLHKPEPIWRRIFRRGKPRAERYVMQPL